MRHLKIFLLSMAVIGLMAAPGFAGTTKVNSAGANLTQYFFSLEAAGSNRNVTLTGPGPGLGATNNAITFTTGQALVSNNLLTVNLTGAAFNGAAIVVCNASAVGAANLNASFGTATPTAGATNFSFQLAVPAASAINVGDVLYLMSGGACNGATNTTFPFMVTPTTSATVGTIQLIAQTSGGITIDTSTAANLVNVKAEYAVGNNSSAHTVDYLATPFNGTKIISAAAAAPNVTADSFAVGAASANVVSITRTANDFNANTGAANAGLTVSAVVGLTDTAAWQGISSVYLVNNATVCTIGANLVVKTTPTGTVSLNVPTTSFAGAASNQYNLCVLADGTDSLQTRTIQANVAVGVTGTGSNSPAASSFANAQVWGLNAYQGLIPFMVNSASVPTFCLVNNGDPARSGSVLVDVLSSEGAVVISNLNIGSVAPKTSQLFSFTGNEIDTVSTTGVAAKVGDLTTLGANVRYAPRMTVTVNPNNVIMTCIQTDPVSGVKRSVPVLTGLANPYHQ